MRSDPSPFIENLFLWRHMGNEDQTEWLNPSKKKICSGSEMTYLLLMMVVSFQNYTVKHKGNEDQPKDLIQVRKLYVSGHRKAICY